MGQARSIGKMTQQGAHKLALAQPLRIKRYHCSTRVSEFAPIICWTLQVKEKPKVWLLTGSLKRFPMSKQYLDSI